MFSKCNNSKEKLLVKTKDGYMGLMTANAIISSGNGISICSIHSPYTIQNIKSFIKNNNLKCQLITDKWSSFETPLIFKCPNCKSVYSRLWGSFRRSLNDLCNDCINEKLVDDKRLDIEVVKSEFIAKGYMPLFDEYKNNSNKLLVRDEFGYLGKMSYKQLMSGSGFRPFHPANKYTITNIRLLLEQHSSNTQLLTNKYKNNLDLMDFECECGEEYTTSLTSILRGSALRCDICTLNQSNLETIVEKWLIQNNLTYIKQYRFDDCRNIYPLPFDFMVQTADREHVIEVHGIQRYQPVAYFGGVDSFMHRQNNDRLKREYCAKNNIAYVEVSYKDIDSGKYETVLTNKLLP